MLSNVAIFWITLCNCNSMTKLIYDVIQYQNVFKCKQTWFDMTTWWNCAVNLRNRPLARKCLNTNSYDHEMTHDQKKILPPNSISVPPYPVYFLANFCKKYVLTTTSPRALRICKHHDFYFLKSSKTIFCKVLYLKS